MKNKNFIKTMNKLSNIPYINYGGCGLAALVLYETAVKEKLNPKIIFIQSDDYSYDVNEAFKEGKIKKATSCNHAVIKINNKLYDSDGEYSLKGDYGFKLQEISKDHLLNSIIFGNWNPTFDRQKWLGKIEKMIGKNIISQNS